MRQFLTLVVVLSGILLGSAVANAQEPGWYGRVVLPESQRRVIEATPITQRPYRPLHFYGNTVRRRYYRGRTLPSVRDFGAGSAVWAFRR